MKHILVVDDEPAMRLALREVLRRKGYNVAEADCGPAALAYLDGRPDVDLILSDVRMPEMTGTELLKRVASRYPAIPFVIMTAFGTIEDAVEAMRQGARDYIMKPFAGETIVEIIEKAVAGAQGSEDLDAEVACADMDGVEDDDEAVSPDLLARRSARPIHGSGRLVFADPLMASIIAMLDEVSDSQATVLLEGESGTGKEILARYLHQKSPRRKEAFVAVNCAALPEGLLESELFGHEKGSFTGAIQSRKGKFELANGGTILLDEISEMPTSLQAKLLRVLQEHEIDPVGARATVSIDIRVVATTNRDLAQAVRNGDFREDLYYRLNVINVRVPPLRERTADILPLAEFFLKKHCRRNHRPTKSLGMEMIEHLVNARWPGNVRELENFIERAVLLCKDPEITPNRIFLRNGQTTPMGATYAEDRLRAPGPRREFSQVVEARSEDMDLDDRPSAPAPQSVAMSRDTDDLDGECESFVTLEEMEKRLILSTLEKVGGNRTRAADMLGVSVRTIRNKLAQYREEMAPNGA